MSWKNALTDSFRRVFSAYVERCARPGILLAVQAEAEGLPLGCSKIGGCPDLPPGTPWPVYADAEGRDFPHAFFAQLNLADFAAEDVAHELPPDGLLSFFAEMDANDGAWDGSSPADWGRWQVFYTEAGAALERRPLPAELDSFWHLPERGLAATPSRLIPPDLAHLEDDPDAFDAFVDACEGDDETAEEAYLTCRTLILGRKDEHERRPLLLGCPDIEQYPMEPLCEAAARRHARGVDDAHPFSPEEEADVECAAGDWQLLFQYSNVWDEEEGEYLFGDFPGNLYFWMRRQDLAARRFCEAWACVQCD